MPESWRTTSVVIGSAAYGSVKARIAARQATLTGQQHHAVSKKVHGALENNPNLRGQYQYRDPRLTTQAKDLASHKGYQKWHRGLDDEIVDWVNSHSSATPSQFEKHLRWRYGQPDLNARFPNGLGGGKS